jgi:hypothetical protein
MLLEHAQFLAHRRAINGATLHVTVDRDDVITALRNGAIPGEVGRVQRAQVTHSTVREISREISPSSLVERGQASGEISRALFLSLARRCAPSLACARTALHFSAQKIARVQ